MKIGDIVTGDVLVNNYRALGAIIELQHDTEWFEEGTLLKCFAMYGDNGMIVSSKLDIEVRSYNMTSEEFFTLDYIVTDYVYSDCEYKIVELPNA